MGKERRLGRGLEALLGQLPSRGEPAAAPPAQPQRPATEIPDDSKPAGAASSSAPSAEALFRLDTPHAAAGQFSVQPHYPASQRNADDADAAAADQSDASGVTGSASVLSPSAPPARLNVHQIDSNPAQPRQEFGTEEMRSLAESISAHGLLQPVVVRRVHDRYQLVAGERRLRAAIQAGWTDVPVNVIEADDRRVTELAIVENLQRKDLNALEKAAAFQKYLEQYGCTQEELASRLKLDRSTVANLIRLLELPKEVQDAMRRGYITPGHARALLPLGDEREQIEFCHRIQREGLNVRQTESLVQELVDAADREPLAAADAPPTSARRSRSKNEHTAAMEQEFHAALGMKVKLSHNARGRGKLVICFRDHEEFARLKDHICGG